MRRLLLVLLVAALAVPAGATATPSVKTTRLPNLKFLIHHLGAAPVEGWTIWRAYGRSGAMDGEARES